MPVSIGPEDSKRRQGLDVPAFAAPSQLDRIAAILKVNPSVFQSRPRAAGSATDPAALPTFLASEDGHALLENFLRIGNPEIRNRVVDMIERIADAGSPDRMARG